MRFQMTPGRRLALDIAMLAGVIALGIVACILIWMSVSPVFELAAVILLTASAALGVYLRIATHPDHVRALQSHHLLAIANESLAHLRRGLTTEGAQAVCRLTLSETEAAAVAITDQTSVLGFAGVGEDHHTVGGPIITRATRDAVKFNERRIMMSQEEIGCPKRDCRLRAAIVVPLRLRDVAVGTLKFYYTTPRLINETQLTMVEGLAQLLSAQLETSELDRQTELACRMELKALQAQIDPHFLFNTINTIAAMIRTDPVKARELLRDFAALYRHTIETREELISLSAELDYVRRYLVFEQARFGDSAVRFAQDVPDDLGAVLIPAFSLQPIVENAVQHGMVSGKALHITVHGQRDGERVTITVSDDGGGIAPKDLPRVLEPGFGSGLGIALGNVDERLRGHFGADSGLRVSSTPGAGTTVTAVIAGPALSLRKDG